MLIDIATEELSHLEVIGTIVAMLNKVPKDASLEEVAARRCQFALRTTELFRA